VVDGEQRRTRSDLDQDEAALARYADELADAVVAALPRWVERSVEQRFGGPVPPEVRRDVEDAGRAAATEVGGQVRRLLRLDLDEQWTNPLALLRAAVTYPAGVLRRAGAAPPHRDAEAVRLHPDDVYDLAPAAFADVDPALHDPGIVWGAAKAHVHLARRRREGRR
jgi:hypothetical protein